MMPVCTGIKRALQRYLQPHQKGQWPLTFNLLACLHAFCFPSYCTFSPTPTHMYLVCTYRGYKDSNILGSSKSWSGSTRGMCSARQWVWVYESCDVTCASCTRMQAEGVGHSICHEVIIDPLSCDEWTIIKIYCLSIQNEHSKASLVAGLCCWELQR